MADRYTDVVILCEDQMHLSFVRRYLIKRGIQSRRIRGNVAPGGQGAGTQFVLNNYPKQVQAIRSRFFLRAGLVAVIDADKTSVDDRLRQLEQSLAQDGQPGRRDGERIGLLAPKRNIETWIFRLLGNEANEEDDYKKRVASSDLKESVAAFAVMCAAKADTIPLPSLKHACKELTAFIDRGR
jgi:hypothetical protein